MTGKRKSIVHRVSAILGAALVLSFAGGCFVLYSVERSNTEYIYQLTRELMDSSISRMENEMGEIKTLIYDIAVSYTHLDVYKRQGDQRRGRRAGAYADTVAAFGPIPYTGIPVCE